MALLKILFPRLVWLYIENLPSQTSLSTSKKYHPRQDFLFTIIIYLVWGISENPLRQASLASNRKSSFPDQSVKHQKKSSQTNYHFHNKISIKSGALVKIPFTRLVWLVIENLPVQTSLSTTKKISSQIRYYFHNILFI